MPGHNPIDDTVPQRVARYSKLVPYKDAMKDANNIPQEAMMMMVYTREILAMMRTKFGGRAVAHQT